LKAANAIFAEKDGVREDYDSIKDTLFNTSELEAERLRLQEEMNVVAELIEQCVAENARIALDQTEYQKKYDGLAGRFNRAKERLEEVGQSITERQAKREKIGRFVSALEKLDGPLTAFREDDWYSLVEYATVYSKEDIRFTFKNGMEVKV
ncbi:recombinase family protein, partial [Lachnospiraceae bacterium]|nr:recombinase family protein [Lachnospiraceae bacterium]